jgi:hypothetical protein
MVVDEAVDESGQPVLYTLVAEPPGFALYEGGSRVGIYSSKILCEVMQRYARPLEDTMKAEGETLALGSTESLLAWYYKSPVDLENKLYLVLRREGQEAIAVLSRQVVSALRFLSRSASA